MEAEVGESLGLTFEHGDEWPGRPARGRGVYTWFLIYPRRGQPQLPAGAEVQPSQI